MRVTKKVREAYREAILDYGRKYWQGPVSLLIADHADEFVKRAPEKISHPKAGFSSLPSSSGQKPSRAVV